jgi:hypothetical protein
MNEPIRWDTVERLDGTPLYGALMPETYASQRSVRLAQRRLEMTRPSRSSPFRASEQKRVRYFVFARREDEPQALTAPARPTQRSNRVGTYCT